VLWVHIIPDHLKLDVGLVISTSQEKRAGIDAQQGANVEIDCPWE